MSKPMKIISLLFVVVLVAAVVLTMFGKPPNLPLGPLQGMLASDDVATEDGSSSDAGTDVSTPSASLCPPGYVMSSTADAPTDAGAGTPDAEGAAPGGVDPAGQPTDPAAGAQSNAATPGTAPQAAPGAADTPAGGDAAGTAGAGGLPAGCVPDTGAGTGHAPGMPGGSGTPGGTDTPAPGAGGAPGATPGTQPGAGTPAMKTSDGANQGNSPEALRIAADITQVMQQAKIPVSVTATLVPATGGTGAPAVVKAYRAKVTGAVLVIKLTDAGAIEQWKSAGKQVQVQLVKSFIQRLGKNYPKAVRSISVVDATGAMLAVGDAAAGGGPSAGLVKVF